MTQDWRRDKNELHLSRPTKCQRSANFSYSSFLLFLWHWIWARARGLAILPIVLVFHSIYFAPSKIIYIFLGARCDLSCLASTLSWWHRCGKTAESRAHPRHTHTWRATNNTFYNNFIIRFPFICLVRSADAAGDAPASVCRCCLPAALIFIGLISP